MPIIYFTGHLYLFASFDEIAYSTVVQLKAGVTEMSGNNDSNCISVSLAFASSYRLLPLWRSLGVTRKIKAFFLKLEPESNH